MPNQLTQLNAKLSDLSDYVNTLNTSGKDWIPFAVKSQALYIYYDIIVNNLISMGNTIAVGKEVVRFDIIDEHLFVYYTDGSSQDLGKVVGDEGPPGDPGRGILSVTQPSGPTTAQVNYTSGSPDTIALPEGPAGPAGDRYATTSTTSIPVPNHNDVVIMTVGTGLSYTPQQTVIVAYDGIASFTATVNSYDANTGIINLTCLKKTGSGTYNTWTVNLTGAPGTQGDTGPAGPSSLAPFLTDIQVVEHFESGRASPGWTFSDAPGGTSINAVQITGLYGALTVGTGTGGTGQATMYKGVTAAVQILPTIQFSNLTISVMTMVQFLNLPTVGSNALFVIGFGSTINADVNAIVIEALLVSGVFTFRLRTTATSVNTTALTSVTIVSGRNYQLVFRATSSQVQFWIDNILVGTISTNIPANSYLTPIVIARRTGGSGTNNQVILDYYAYRLLTTRTTLSWPT